MLNTKTKKTAQKPLPFLRGETLYLRPLKIADALGAYAEWFNDPVVCAGNSHHVRPYTRTQAKAYIDRSLTSPDELVLAMVDAIDDRHIGNIALKRIDPISRSAELAIIIGDTRAWGKGYGKEACRLLMDHGFFVMNLRRIHCATFENNIGMQKLAEYLGMKEEGRRRQAVFKQNRYLDVLEYGVLRDEYLNRFGQQAVDNKG